MPKRLDHSLTLEQAKHSHREQLAALRRREQAIAELKEREMQERIIDLNYLRELSRNPFALDGSTVVFVYISHRGWE